MLSVLPFWGQEGLWTLIHFLHVTLSIWRRLLIPPLYLVLVWFGCGTRWHNQNHLAPAIDCCDEDRKCFWSCLWIQQLLFLASPWAVCHVELEMLPNRALLLGEVGNLNKFLLYCFRPWPVLFVWQYLSSTQKGNGSSSWRLMWWTTGEIE